MNSFDLTIAENKLKFISLLKFPRILQQLKIYLKFINYLREYVSFYVDIFKSLQARKTKFFRKKSIARNVKKIYFNRTKIRDSTNREIIFF